LRFWIIVTVIWILTVVIVNLGWIAPKDYSVFGAPFLEEAVKGYSAFLIAALLYQIPKKFKIGLRNSGILWGLLVGFLIGYVEVFQYKTIQIHIILLKLIQHPLWTIAVSVGFCSFLLTSKKSLPIIVYLTAVGAHASWNFNVYYTSALALPISIVLTLLAIMIALSTFPKLVGARSLADILRYRAHLLAECPSNLRGRRAKASCDRNDHHY